MGMPQLPQLQQHSKLLEQYGGSLLMVRLIFQERFQELPQEYSQHRQRLVAHQPLILKVFQTYTEVDETC